MPTINNYTFSPISFQIEEQTDIADSIGQNFATITIYPNDGFTVAASDFSASGYNESYIDSVEFVQSGSNVICNVFFVAGITMPSANVDLTLCITGQGVENEITIGGFFSANISSNISGDSTETDTPYSNSGALGETELLFSKTYTANTDYYLDVGNGMQITQGNQSNYNIVQTPTYDSNGRLTSINYAVNYIYPNQSISGDRINIRLIKALEIYNPLPKISGYIFDTSVLGNPEETRTLTVIGIPGTTFSATLDDGSTVTTIINNEDIGDNGKYEYDITFPALTKGNPNVTYEIELTGSYVSDVKQANPFTLEQLNEVYIEIDVTNPPTPISGWPVIEPRVTYKALSSTPFNDVNNSSGVWLIEIDEDITPFSGTGTFTVDKQVELADFSEATTITAVTDGAQTNSTTLVLDDTTGILAGDKFNYVPWDLSHDPLLAPFTYEVLSKASGTNLTISPAITIVDEWQLTFTRSNGNIIQILESDVTLVDPSTVNLKFSVAVINYGDANITFDLDLSNIISYTP